MKSVRDTINIAMFCTCLYYLLRKYTTISSFVNNAMFTNIEIYYLFYFILLVVSMVIMQIFAKDIRFHKWSLPSGKLDRFRSLHSKLSIDRMIFVNLMSKPWSDFSSIALLSNITRTNTSERNKTRQYRDMCICPMSGWVDGWAGR